MNYPWPQSYSFGFDNLEYKKRGYAAEIKIKLADDLWVSHRETAIGCKALSRRINGHLIRMGAPFRMAYSRPRGKFKMDVIWRRNES